MNGQPEQDNNPDEMVDVLVVGGGACGLTSALLLALEGVSFLLVEKHPGTSYLPKAHILNPPTMEIFHRLGIGDEVHEKGTPNENFSEAVWHTSLGGDEAWDRQMIFRCDTWGGGGLEEDYARWTPYPFSNLNQKLLEPVLRRNAEERTPGQIRFGHRVTDWVNEDDGIRVTVSDEEAGNDYQVRAKYLIAADGGQTFGPALGIGLEGPEPFVDMVSVHFRADLSEYMDNDRQLHMLFASPQLDGEVILHDLVSVGPDKWGRSSEEWHLLITLPAGAKAEQEAYDEERGAADVRQLLKVPDLDLEVLHVSHWLVQSALAKHYRSGRVFLAGDAAHRHPPNGGLGMNLGLQDAANLCWKLAAVIRGEAGEALLDSYEDERRKVGGELEEWATFRFFSYMSSTAGFGLVPGAPEDWNRKILESLFADSNNGRGRRALLEAFYEPLGWEYGEADVELGFSYPDSPVVVPDGTPEEERDPTGREHRPSARPGHRLPHAWITRGEVPVSTQQLITPGRFLLVLGEDSEDWVAAARTVSPELEVVVIDGGEYSAGDDWRELRGHDEGGALLVRPDQHVAFRALTRSDDAAADLIQALATALGTGDRAGQPALESL